MSFISDYTTKLRMAFDRTLPGEARAFAFCECVFQPISFATLLAAGGFAVASRFGAGMPQCLAKVFPVLLSAAVGYLTNWIAIEMLFKPYQRTWHHPFAWLTGGYWRQGLVPKNKDAIVDRRTLERGLLNWLNDPETLPALRDELLQFVKEFHGMINEVSAQHLGAIQVLGYILGALAGGLLLLARF